LSPGRETDGLWEIVARGLEIGSWAGNGGEGIGFDWVCFFERDGVSFFIIICGERLYINCGLWRIGFVLHNQGYEQVVI